VSDPVLRSRRRNERAFIREVAEELSPRTALVPWRADGVQIVGAESEDQDVLQEEVTR
jgi:hypothetical protein